MVRMTETTGVYTWLAIRAGQLSRGRPLAVVASLAVDHRGAVGVPGQPDDGAADGADHVPARRRAGHRPDPAGDHRDHRLQHRRHRDADRRPAEHPDRRRDRAHVHRLHRQPRADRRAHVRRGHRSASTWVFRRQPADRARGAPTRDGARRAPLDRGPGRAQAHRAGPDRHDPALLRPPAAAPRARDRRADRRDRDAARQPPVAREVAGRDRVADAVLLHRPVRDGRRARGDAARSARSPTASPTSPAATAPPSCSASPGPRRSARASSTTSPSPPR